MIVNDLADKFCCRLNAVLLFGTRWNVKLPQLVHGYYPGNTIMGKQKSIPDRVCSLLNSGEQLSHLGRMLDKQRALLLAVRSQLPSPLDQHCLYARISGKLLIIHTDSPVWNARLRFHGPQLIRAMQQQAPHLQQLKINIHIDAVHKPPKRRQIRLSKNNAAQILEAADSIDDPMLQAALRRLGNSGSKKEN